MTLLFFSISLLLWEPQNPTPPAAPAALIEDVQIRGNRRIPSDTIKFNLLTKPGGVLDSRVVQRDLRTVYALGFFEDIRVEEEQGERGAILAFIVKEKPLVRKIEYKGNKSITNSEILEKLRERKVGLTAESPYDPVRVKRAKAVLEEMLALKGRQNAEVEVETETIPPNAIGVTFKINEGRKVKIEKIEIEGNTVFSDGKIRRMMKLLKETSPLTVFTGKDVFHELKLADDITRIRMLYAEHGYVRANVSDPEVRTGTTKVFRTLPFVKPPAPYGIPLPVAQKNVERFFIKIKIEENSQYKVGSVKVAGNKEFTPGQIQAVLGLIPGQIYNETLLRQGFENLKKLYGSRGYINFTPVPVQDFDEQNKLVHLTINIDEDRQFFVSRISFRGNTTTHDKVIRREIMVDEGRIFNSALWDMSLLRLNQLGYFEEIKNEDVEVSPHATDPNVDITLKVKEKSRNSIGFNGGVSGIGGSFLGLSYSTNNFLGFGESLSIDLQGGSRQSSYRLSFTEPYFLDRPLSLGFSVFSTRLQFDQARELFGLNPDQLPSGLGFENRLNFNQSRLGFNVFGSYPLRVFHRVGLTYEWNDSRTDAVNAATRGFFENVRTQERESFVDGPGGRFTDFRLRKIIPSYTWSTVNNPVNPGRGQSVNATFELTGGPLGGNVNFYRPALEYRYFRPMNRARNTLAFRFMGSHVKGFSGVSTPFFERFFMGGDFDLRGFDFRSISPIAFVTRQIDTIDPETGNTIRRPFDDIVFVGGDTQALANLEYRIPIVGPITVSPFLDVGNSWALRKRQLRREFVDVNGQTRFESVKFLPGTNSGLRTSAGLELQIVLPVINAPFRLIFAYNPNRIDRTFAGPVTGTPFSIRDPRRDIKFTVGRTF